MKSVQSEFWITLLKEEGSGFFGTLMGGVLKGVGLGVLSIFIVYLLFRLLKLLPKKGGGAAKLVTVAWLIITLPVVGGFLGFHRSLEQAVSRLMQEGRFAKEVLPELSVAVSDFVFLLDNEMAEKLEEEKDEDQETLDVLRFQARLEKLEAEWVPELVTQSADQVREAAPFLKEGFPAQLFDGFVEFFGEKILRNQMGSRAEKLGVHFPVQRWLAGLPAAAAVSGGEYDLSREELSTYTVQTLLSAFFLSPMQTLLKIQQTLGIVALVGIVLLPAALLALWHRRCPPQPAGEAG